MKREIKFRAWGVSKLGNSVGQGQWLHLTDCYLGLDGKTYHDDYGILNNEPYFDVMVEQYTGLKDKNGKEIYEGDIIRDENNNLCEIYYYQPDGAWVTFPLKWSFDAYTFFSAFYSLSSYSLNSKRIVEVIGNIHENTELLNES